MIWRCRDLAFDLERRTLVAGVVNVTPDSFSDGGHTFEPGAAIARARRLSAEGADLVDLGAESTRPGAVPVPADEQWRRLEPVLAALGGDPAIVVSVDTADASVAARALAAGARAINDVSALADPDMASVVARARAGIVLMHMQGTPATMQRAPRYGALVPEVRAFLEERGARARRAGIDDRAIAIDPGIGFGKRLEHNLELLAHLNELTALDRPIWVGVSRKSFIGTLTDRPLAERLEGGLAAAAIAVFQGAHVVRTHDVAATVSAVRVARALRRARGARVPA